jgi:hypothetical protein
MAGQDHFVCEHLENISRTALEKYQDLIREFTPYTVVENCTTSALLVTSDHA